MSEPTHRAWLVERTFSDDEQNVVILVYATPDGSAIFRKERALTTFSSGDRPTTAAVAVPERNLSPVTDPDERERYASEARRMAATHEPDDPI